MARIDDLIAGRDPNKQHHFLKTANKKRPFDGRCVRCGKFQRDPIHYGSPPLEPHPYKGSLASGNRCTYCDKPYNNEIHTNVICKGCGKPFRAGNPEIARCPYCDTDVMP